MRDVDIRLQLRLELDRQHRNDPGTLIVPELGICEGAVRIDMAVVNGLLAGYEIKSASDTLERLPAQAEAYSRVFDQVTIVAAGDHFGALGGMVPDWWGITRALPTPTGVVLEPVRASGTNPDVDPFAVVQLLWRDEALDLLVRLGLARGLKGKPRRLLWSRLARALALDDLRRLVRDQLRTRDSWRPGPSPASGDATSPPCARWTDSRLEPCRPRIC